MLAQLATDMIKNLKTEVTCGRVPGESTHQGCAIGFNENCTLLTSGSILFNQHVHLHPAPIIHADGPGGMPGGGSDSKGDDGDDGCMSDVGKPHTHSPNMKSKDRPSYQKKNGKDGKAKEAKDKKVKKDSRPTKDKNKSAKKGPGMGKKP